MITEREMNIDEAYSRLTKMHQHLGLHSKIELSKNNSLVATCHLYDKTYKEVSCGAGKGEHCELGALAESLEHYFVDKSAPAVIGSDQILQSIAPFDDWLLKSIPPGCRLPSFNFQALNSYHEIVIPAILIAPSSKNVDAIEKTAAGFLSKYATNSGTALGCTENEALLHAINEAIERHALSMYYLSLCGLASPLKLYQPSNSFLEETFSHDTELFRCAKKLEIYMTHDFYDVPFCIAVSRGKKEGSLSSLGSGSSINPSIAMYRAVTEQIQCEHLSGTTEKQEDLSAENMLAQSTRLSALLHPCPTYAVPDFHPPRIDLSVRGQVKRTLINLEKENKIAFYRTLYEHPNLATVVQVFIPGLERFHLIRSGIPVAPQCALKGIRQ
ncbi:YcaO-like family protein [Pseudomonas fulva]|uniref:YcaO-like family protein n=1 Tax=Pseudomonas fulva TaxID=47880 RepID=UPI0018A9FFA7|nr:YcaO-like family protein [Pseudomonas fulva]MBF8673451.1 YcaO-like family protein [Pseudomonas fulva]MBF8696373.1 YcaO-like family protein [Pseudomonas fulva]